MKNLWNFILDGYIRLLTPILIGVIVIEKLLHLLSPLIHQIREHLHVNRWVGSLDAFLVSVIVLLLLGLLSGLLLKSKFIVQKTKSIESGILRKIPMYNELKSLLGERTKQQETENYLPALLNDGSYYALGYITDQSDNFYTIVICDTSLHGGELRIVPKDSVKLLDISFFEFARRIRSYGTNAAHFAEELDKTKL